MRARWDSFAAKLQRLFRLVVLFCILRFVVGIAAIAIFDRDAVPWGWHLTLSFGERVSVSLGGDGKPEFYFVSW